VSEEIKGRIHNKDGSTVPMPEEECKLYTELFGIKDDLHTLEIEKAVLKRRFDAVDEKLTLYYSDQNRENTIGEITHEGGKDE